MSAGDREIDRIAAQQFGLIEFKQALAAGMSKSAINRRVRTGAWRRPLPRVYGLACWPRSWHRFLTAAWLWAGRGAAVSHRAAAAVHGLEGVRCDIAELSIRSYRSAPAGRIVLHEVGTLPPADIQRWGPIWVTTPTRTLADLGAVVDEAVLEAALEDALRRGLTSIRRLKRHLNERQGWGPGVLRKVLARRHNSGRPAESVLETRVIRLLRRMGFPPPVRQYEVQVGGEVCARIDLACPELKVGIECEGFRFHSGREAWSRDADRFNFLTANGWRLIKVTWDAVRNRPETVASGVRRLLQACPGADPPTRSPAQRDGDWKTPGRLEA